MSSSSRQLSKSPRPNLIARSPKKEIEQQPQYGGSRSSVTSGNGDTVHGAPYCGVLFAGDLPELGVNVHFRSALCATSGHVWIGDAKGHIRQHDISRGHLLLDAPASDPSNGAINAIIEVPIPSPQGFLPPPPPLSNATANEDDDGTAAVPPPPPAFSRPFDLWIATSGKGIVIVDPATGESRWNISVTGGTLCMALSGCQRFVFSGSADGRISVWSATNRKPIQRLEAHSGAVTALCVYVDDNRSSIAASGDDRGELAVWQPPEEDDRSTVLEFVWRRPSHQGAILAVAFVLRPASTDKSSSNVPDLWVGTGNGFVQVWDLRHREVVASPTTCHGEAVTALLHDPATDRHRVWSCSIDGSVFGWNASDASPEVRLEIGSPVAALTSVGMSQSQRLWVCSEGGMAKCYLSEVSAGSSLSRGSVIAADSEQQQRLFEEQLIVLNGEIRELQVANSNLKAQLVLLQRSGAATLSPTRSPNSPGGQNDFHTQQQQQMRGARATAGEGDAATLESLQALHMLDVALLEMDDAEHFARCQLSGVAFETIASLFAECFDHTVRVASMTSMRCSRETEYWKTVLQNSQTELEEMRSSAAASRLRSAAATHESSATVLSPPRLDAATSPPRGLAQQQPFPQTSIPADTNTVLTDEIASQRRTIQELSNKLASIQSSHTEELIALRKRHADAVMAADLDRAREVASARDASLRDRQRLEDELAMARKQGEDEARLRKEAEMAAERVRNSRAADIDSLTNALAKAQDSEQSQRLLIAQLREQLEKGINERAALAKTLEESRQEKAASSRSVEELHETIASLRTELASATTALTVAQRASSVARSRNEDDIAAQNEAVTLLAQECEELKRAIAQERSENERTQRRLKDDILAMRAPWQAMKDALRESQTTLEDVKKQFLKDVAELEDIIEEREKEIAVLRRKIESSSTSASAMFLGGAPSSSLSSSHHLSLHHPSFPAPVPTTSSPPPVAFGGGGYRAIGAVNHHHHYHSQSLSPAPLTTGGSSGLVSPQRESAAVAAAKRLMADERAAATSRSSSVRSLPAFGWGK